MIPDSKLRIQVLPWLQNCSSSLLPLRCVLVACSFWYIGPFRLCPWRSVTRWLSAKSGAASPCSLPILVICSVFFSSLARGLPILSLFSKNPVWVFRSSHFSVFNFVGSCRYLFTFFLDWFSFARLFSGFLHWKRRWFETLLLSKTCIYYYKFSSKYCFRYLINYDRLYFQIASVQCILFHLRLLWLIDYLEVIYLLSTCSEILYYVFVNI